MPDMLLICSLCPSAHRCKKIISQILWNALICLFHALLPSSLAHALQQPRGYGGYHGVDGAQEAEDGSGEASPHHAKESHLPRELRQLRDHSMSVSDSEGGKSLHPGGPRRTRASSVPHPATDNAHAQRPLATQSADHGAKKR